MKNINVNFNFKTDFILYINDSRQEKVTLNGHVCAYKGKEGRKNWS